LVKETKTSKKKKVEVKQPQVNNGLVGHVDHGKTTLTEKLTGKWTDTHSEELKRGITIRLGYADTTFYKCTKCRGSNAYCVKDKCPKCENKCKVLRKVSFVDAPGHESLMATMLSGATIMDGALLIIAANEKCPQPQTREHLMALKISDIKNVVIVQNKVDLVTEEEAIKHHKQIKDFIKGTEFEKAPIIPVSAQHNIGVGPLIEAIEKFIPTPKRNPKKDPLMFVARSFDINKPGLKPKDFIGGVLGGALIQGVLKTGDVIEIKPGYEVEEKNQKIYKPIETKITDLKTGGQSVKEVHPGGSIGILTSLDPGIVKSDYLAGSIVGLKGKLPPVWYNLKLEAHLLKKVIGAKKDLPVEQVKMNEVLMLTVNNTATVGVVISISKNLITCKLKRPVCAGHKAGITISRLIDQRFRLIGYGVMKE